MLFGVDFPSTEPSPENSVLDRLGCLIWRLCNSYQQRLTSPLTVVCRALISNTFRVMWSKVVSWRGRTILMCFPLVSLAFFLSWTTTGVVTSNTVLQPPSTSLSQKHVVCQSVVSWLVNIQHHTDAVQASFLKQWNPIVTEHPWAPRVLISTDPKSVVFICNRISGVSHFLWNFLSLN